MVYVFVVGMGEERGERGGGKFTTTGIGTRHKHTHREHT